MRHLAAVALAALFAALVAVPAAAQSCPAGQTTSISGTIYAPNGRDPLPNVLVFIPTTTVQPFTAGVSCPVPGELPSGAPVLAGTITATDGTFTLTNVPVGANIPLVVQAGRWRRQTVIPGTVACQNTPVDPATTRMPRNKTEGDIPRIAVVTGSVDQVECVLRKVGIDDTEFSDATGSGRINLFQGSKTSSSPGGNMNGGALYSPSTPDASTLMGNQTLLNSYDVLMLPCEGGESNPARPAAQLNNLMAYANAGGRVYASHFSYDWMYHNGPFSGVVNWNTNAGSLPDGTATIDISFAGGQTLAEWLQLVGATSTKGQMAISTLRRDQSGVVAPTQSWMTLNSSGNPVMQFTFNTPVGSANQCGRVLFDEYHVENGSSSAGKIFPVECSAGQMTPQEKLLEFTLFDLTGSGGAPTLKPSSADYGNQPVHYASAAKSFTWTNNSIFPATVKSWSASGDFSVSSTNCGVVNAGASCTINVVFRPSALGPETGTLTVESSASTLTAALSGTGVPDLTATPTLAPLDFGKVDVGATSRPQTVVWMNSTGSNVTVPPLTVSGDFAIAGSTCGTTLGPGATCSISLTFTPTITGARTGAFNTSSTDPGYSGLQTALTGTGMDFSISIDPSSGSVIAGHTSTPVMTLTPSTGFSGNITLNCPATAAGTSCSTGAVALRLTALTKDVLTISTIAKYDVLGYEGMGGGGKGVLWLIGTGSGLLLWLVRRRARTLMRAGLLLLLLAVGALALNGCSGHLPDLNNPYTPAGTYTYTVTASDGTLTRTATYSLTVTVK